MPEHDPILISVVCLWFTLFGACVGSFLNVLVYRLPLRKSLVHPPSHCPRCGHLIRWYDNIPVFGWLKLRGKCRDCQLPISMRYPCVEGFCGILFGGLFAFFVHQFDYSLELLSILTFFASLLSVSLLAGLLIAYDGKGNGREG